MTRYLTEEELSGTSAQYLSETELGGTAEEPSVLGFLKDPQSWRDMGSRLGELVPAPKIDVTDQGAVERAQRWAVAPQKEALKSALGLAAVAGDILPATVGMLADVPGRVGVVGAAKAKGESWKTAGEAAIQHHALPSNITAPFARIAEALGPEAQQALEDNPLGFVFKVATEAIEAGAGGVEKRTGLPGEYVQMAAEAAMGFFGTKAMGKSAKAALWDPQIKQLRPVDAQMPGYVDVDALTKGALAKDLTKGPELSAYERVAPMEELYPEQAIIQSKQRIAQIKKAVKEESPELKLQRMSAVIYPEGTASWKVGGKEQPVQVQGSAELGPDGVSYTPAIVEGTRMMVPTAELGPRVAEAQPGFPPPVTPEAQVTPKTRLKEGVIVGEKPSAVITGLDKVREGRAFDMTAEERVSVDAVQKAAGRIVGTDGKPLMAGFKQGGAIDPRLLAALGISSMAVYAALDPKAVERLSELGLVGFGATMMRTGEGRTFGMFTKESAPYRFRVVEALPKDSVSVGKQQVTDLLNRPELQAERPIVERVLAATDGDKISAKRLQEGLLEETQDWGLVREETKQYADYGLENLAGPFVGAAGKGPFEGTATTTLYRLPEHMQFSDANHFGDARLFGWTRSLEEGGIRHVVEIQSDLAQHAKGAVSEAERPALIAAYQETLAEAASLRTLQQMTRATGVGGPNLEGIREGLKKQGFEPRNDASDARYLEQLADATELRARELRVKTEATAVTSQLSPIIKHWPRRLIREELRKAGEAGEAQVRFASADTVAKVEGWPRALTAERAAAIERETGISMPAIKTAFQDPGHQSIYNRYAGEITRYLKGLGGKEVTDAQGHTWFEVPVESVVKGQGIHMLGAADPKLLAKIAAAGGAAAYLAANPDQAELLATLGLAGTVAAKGRSLKDVLEPVLIQRARGGDSAAFTELYAREFPRLQRSVASFEKQGLNAEDIAQRALEKFFKALGRPEDAPGGFRGDSQVATWLYRAAQNEAKNQLKAAESRPQTEPLDLETPEGQTLAETLGHGETPQKIMENRALGERLAAAMEKVDPAFREAFELRELEGLSYEAIAEAQGVPVGTVRSRIFRAKEQLQRSLGRSERGEVDPKLLFGMGATVAGATLGALIADDGSKGAITGGMLGLGLGLVNTKPGARVLGRGTTRLMLLDPTLRRGARDMDRVIQKEVSLASDAISAFTKPAKKLPKETYAALDQAYSEANTTTLKAIVDRHPELREGYAKLRAFLQKTEVSLQALGRFKEGLPDYLPLLVKDYKGLMEHLGQETREALANRLHKANAKSIKKMGRELNETERAAIVTDYLLHDPATSYLPGYAKTRRLKMTPETRQFYHSLEDALIHYGHAAVEDISTARFFGQDLRVLSEKGHQFTNIDASIGAYVERALREGRLTDAGAVEARGILKARFDQGRQAPPGWMQDVRNASSTALLGQIGSGLVQTSESLLSGYHHGIKEALQAASIVARGKGIKPSEFGLANHVIEEVIGQRATGKALSGVLKVNLLAAIDQLGISQNLTASFVKNKALVNTPRGIAKLQEKWGADYGPDFPRLVEELQASTRTQRTPLVDSLLWQELADVRPVSRIEATELYNANPNLRLLYHLKQFALTQADILYRDSWLKIESGNPKQVAVGVKNLALYATALSLAVVPADAIKNWLMGRGLRLDKIDYVDNFVRNFGLSRYTMTGVGQSSTPGKAVLEAAEKIVKPPAFSVGETLAKGLSQPKELVPLVPLGGRIYYNRALGGNEKAEIAEHRKAGKGGQKQLSPAAKAYIKQKQAEKKRKELAR